MFRIALISALAVAALADTAAAAAYMKLGEIKGEPQAETPRDATRDTQTRKK